MQNPQMQLLNLQEKIPSLVENKIIAFLSSEQARADRSEISAGTINNWVKAARLYLEMSDVQLNWKKIRRVSPRARRYALDRVPTIDELREILDAADLRGKALTLIFVVVLEKELFHTSTSLIIHMLGTKAI